MKRLLLFGFITWLMPFIISIAFYSKEGKLVIDPFLFQSIMTVSAGVAGAVMLVLYFKKIKGSYLQEGVRAGFIWLAMNLLLDMLILVPMAKMSMTKYFNEIGIQYLLIPIMSIAIGYVVQKKSS